MNKIILNIISFLGGTLISVFILFVLMSNDAFLILKPSIYQNYVCGLDQGNSDTYLHTSNGYYWKLDTKKNGKFSLITDKKLIILLKESCLRYYR